MQKGTASAVPFVFWAARFSHAVNKSDTCLQYTLPMSAKDFTFELLEGADPNEHTYRLSGPLVLHNMFDFQRVLRSESATTILDLTGVPYMDSAALGVLTNSHVSHQTHGRKLLLAGVNDRIMELFRLTNLDRIFQIFPSVESARLAQ
jgi:anti-sigma B factor antagonist